MYRSLTPPCFPSARRGSLAIACVVLSLQMVVLVALCPCCFAQITHPYAAKPYETSFKKIQKNFGQLLSGVTLRTSLTRISENVDVPIWLDRRVDGEQLVSISQQESTVGETLDQLAEQSNTKVVWLNGVLYVCRLEHAPQVLQTFWQISTASNGKLSTQFLPAVAWDTPSEPQKLLAEIFGQQVITLQGQDLIEHDLWAPRKLPSLDMATLLTAFLAGFELSIESTNDTTLKIVKAKTPEQFFAWPYEPSVIRSIPKDKQTQWQEKWKDQTKWRTQGKFQWLQAPVEAHRELITATIKTTEPRKVESKRDNRRYTLQLRGRLEDVLPPLLQQLQLTLAAPLSQEIGNRTIDIQAKNVSVVELLDQIGQATNCTMTLNGSSVTVVSD